MDIKEVKKKAIEMVYAKLNTAYCYNCRFHSEMNEDEQKKEYGCTMCDVCHRKEQNWSISKATCEQIVNDLLKTLGIEDV